MIKYLLLFSFLLLSGMFFIPKMCVWCVCVHAHTCNSYTEICLLFLQWMIRKFRLSVRDPISLHDNFGVLRTGQEPSSRRNPAMNISSEINQPFHTVYFLLKRAIKLQ